MNTVIGMPAVPNDTYNSYIDRAMWAREMYVQGQIITAKAMLVDLLVNYNEIVAQGFGDATVANVIAITARMLLGKDAPPVR